MEIRFADSGEAVIPDRQQWFEYRTPSGGFRVLLNRFPHHQVEELRKRWLRTNIEGKVEVLTEKCIAILAEKFVADVDGLVDQDGAQVIATEQVKVMLLTEMFGFYMFVLSKLQDDEVFRKKGAPVSSITGAVPASSEALDTAAA